MNPKSNPADPGGEQRQAVQQSRRAFRHAQVAHDVGQDQGVEHGVEGIEHPAQGRGEESAALRGGDLAQREGAGC